MTNGRNHARDASAGVVPPGHRGTVFLVLLLVGILALVFSPSAWTDPPEEDPPVEDPEKEVDLLAELVSSEGTGAWRGLLNRIVSEKDAQWIDETLGELFRDRVKHDEHAECAAFTAAYLADHPAEGRVLLGPTILRRADGDTEFLEAVRGHITRGEGGWERLRQHASELLVEADATSQRAAIWLISHESGPRRKGAVSELEERARQTTVGGAGPDGLPQVLAAAYLEGFDRLLGYRFASLTDALERLADLEGKTLAEVILHLSRRKDRPDSPQRVQLLEYGKRLVDQVVTAGHVEGLKEFLDPRRTPSTSLRRYAMQRATQLGSATDGVWGKLLRIVLAAETDPQVLRGGLDLLVRTGFAEKGDEAQQLASAVVSRLEQRGPDAASAADAVEDRVRLAKIVGSLGVRPPELAALLEDEAALEDQILAELVRALGSLPGVRSEELLAYYRASAGDSPREHGVRVAAVDALGRPGLRVDGGDPEAAAEVLREILTGEGEVGVGRSEDAEVRQHAIRSLGGYPGPRTADVLRDLALGPNGAEARGAIVVLSKAASTVEDAARVLAELAQKAEAEGQRRVDALRALGGLGQAGGAVKDLAVSAVGAVLGSDAPGDVRLTAAAAARQLSDARLFGVVLAYFTEEPSEERRDLLVELLATVAKADEAHDEAVGDILIRLARTGHSEEAQAASQALEEAVGPRPLLRLARARTCYVQAGDESRDMALRRSDLAAAAEILKDVVAGEDAPRAAALFQVEVMQRQGELAAKNGEKKARLLAAVAAAVKSTGGPTARLGLEILARLEVPPLATLLTPAEKERLAKSRKALESRLPP